MDGEDNQNQPVAPDQIETSDKKPSLMPVIVVVLLLVFGGTYFFKNMKGNTVTPTSTTAPIETVAPTPTPSGPVKEFTVNASNYKFDTKKITVDKGDTVKVTLKSTEGTHDFALDEFDVKTEILPSGGEQTVTFTADKTGTFEYYCSVGNHRQMGMVGKLIVQ